MIELIIKKIDGYNYYLESIDNLYKLNMEFYDLKVPLAVNDMIYMHENLLQEKELAFGSLDDKSGKTLHSSQDSDIIIVRKNDENIYLKRVYG